ncbi:MAG: N-formylglutamate amidohydrolase [Acidobacteria bacterium]|nr:N-formylglutamate amidohydrolase [Acidobacteriota bacterium]
MADQVWQLVEGDGPIVAAAIHDGHDLRQEVAALMALSDAERLREEDPYTGSWTEVAPVRLVGRRSRFEVDLNRPREKAIYATPADAWGLNVWTDPLPPALVARSLEEYDAFYVELSRLLTGRIQRFGGVLVLDFHTYNHRREGPDGPSAEPLDNPEVNIGTASLDRERWAPLVDRFISDLRGFNFLGRHLDVRENVKFQGGNMSRWIHKAFPTQACSLSIEFKKFFMDEWSGTLDTNIHEEVTRALQSTLPGLREELAGVID